MTAPLPWKGHPLAPAPLAAALRLRLAGERVQLVDDAGRPVAMSSVRWPYEALRAVACRAGELLLAALAWLIVPRRPPAPAAPAAPGDGPCVLVLPVLPDLSHTFVYREVLALLQRRPQWRVVALEHNAGAPVHPEAAALLQRAVFVERRGVLANAWRQLRWLLRRRGRELFAVYRAEPGSGVRALLGKAPLREPRHPGNALALAELLAPWRPAQLHVYGSTYAANVAMGAALLLELPFSITSYVDFEFAYAHKMLAVKLLRARWFRVCTQCCQVRLQALHAIDAARAPVVYFGLDLGRWQQQAPLPGDGVLFTAARLVAKKGLLQVPPALAALQAQGIACRWRVAGDGPLLQPLRELAARHGVADRIELLGPLDNAAVRAQLMAADAALLPCIETLDGERDGIPIFLTEAMALGLPVVTTPVGGIPELVRDGDTGFLARPGDASSLAQVLAALLRDPARARAVGGRGRAEVHATQDVEHSADRLLALLEGGP